MKVVLQALPKKEVLIFEYQFYKTILGNLLLVSWKQHLVAVAFVSSQKQAVQELRNRFPKVTLARKETAVQKSVVRYIEEPTKFSETLSIVVAGSPFYLKVWKALLTLPFGQTCFYSDIAKVIKKPSAVRAVASAVAKNPVAILIPCHRVLPKGGGVGNYHWGSKNKSALLTWESLTLAK